MRYSVVYESNTGNTKMLADAIQHYLGEENCVYFGKPDTGSIPDSEVIFIGFWTDKGDCVPGLAEFMGKLNGKKVFLFGTAGFGGSPEYFLKIEERVRAHLPEGTEVAGTYMCQGKMPQGVRKRYETMLENNPEDSGTKAMIENFDRALLHPDDADLEKLRKEIRVAVKSL